MLGTPVVRTTLFLALALATPVGAELYSYENAEGDYVISQERPESGEYAVLTEDGEFIELVSTPSLQVPITHWRPWYLPQQPNPFDPVQPAGPAEPTVTIEEVGEAREN